MWSVDSTHDAIYIERAIDVPVDDEKCMSLNNTQKDSFFILKDGCIFRSLKIVCIGRNNILLCLILCVGSHNVYIEAKFTLSNEVFE